MIRIAKIFVLVTTILGILLTLFYMRNEKFKSVPDEFKNIIFYEGISYSPRDPDDLSYQRTTIYFSGDVVLEGVKEERYKFNQNEIEEIKNYINSTGVINENCKKEIPVHDIYITYFIQSNGKGKLITYPSCSEYTDKIKLFISKYLAKYSKE